MYSAKTIFKDKLNSLLKTNDIVDYTLINKVFILSFLFLKERDESIDVNDWELTFQLFEILGAEKFINFLSKTTHRVIILPSEEDLKESVMLAMIYFYRNIERYDWKKIKEILNLPNLNSIKYSVKLQKLEAYLQQKLEEASTGHDRKQ